MRVSDSLEINVSGCSILISTKYGKEGWALVYRWAFSISPLILQIFISEKTNRMIRLFLPSNKVVWGLIWG